MGTVDSRYAAPEGRKVRVDSYSPAALLKNPNRVTLAVLAVILVLLLVVFAIIRLATRKRRRKKHTYYGYRSYRG
jgi:flagellar biosynthesis/type III secretory pathway M-ring protein FliF/YscJ